MLPTPSALKLTKNHLFVAFGVLLVVTALYGLFQTVYQLNFDSAPPLASGNALEKSITDALNLFNSTSKGN